MTIHHATLAKAQKLGVVMDMRIDTGIVCAHWVEKNKRAYGMAAPAVLADMVAWQMLTREYANLKVEQPHVKDANFVWEISLRKDVIGEGERLNEAFLDAADVLGGGESEENDEAEYDAEEKEEFELNGAEAGDGESEGDEGDADPLMVGEGEDDDAPEGKSVVKRKYKQRYRPFKMTCGDELSKLITAHVTVETEEGKRIDRAKLVKFAKANHAWDDRYKLMNIGMVRMNVGNKLRGILRKNPDTVVIWN